MKKVLILIIIYIGIGIVAFSIFKMSNKYELKIIRNNMDCSVLVKGCSFAQAIAVDDQNTIYIGYKDSIKIIDNRGKFKELYHSGQEELEDLVYKDSNLYFISKDSIKKVSITDGHMSVILTDIPKGGNGIKRKLLVKDKKLYLSVGAVTNSGVKEDGSLEVIPADKEEIYNAAIFEIDIKQNKSNMFATGIRGVTGIDVNSKGEIIAIFSGMKNEGNRPVNRDRDYFYRIEKNTNYGWPDYSGGDPIDSPRFKGKDIVKPILQKEPLKLVNGPIYQSKYLDSLREMAIDREGKLLTKDSILFWNSNEQSLCDLTENNIVHDILKLNKNSQINDIVYSKEGFYILDQGLGCIYQIKQRHGFLRFELPIEAIVFICVLMVTILAIFIRKIILRIQKI